MTKCNGYIFLTPKYNIFVDCSDTCNTILYNSLYGSLTLWSQTEIAMVKYILNNPTKFENNPSDIKTALLEQKNLVDDSTDETAIIENRKRMGIKDENRLDVIIMPTLDCNFACVYCYETHHDSKMTDKTEIAIKKWLATQIPIRKIVMLHWFGGEPLISYKRIISITQYATNIAAEVDGICVVHITTNGYLLNKKRIQELVNIGIYDFQITVDGLPEIHDKLRILRNGKGTFKQLFQNIVNLTLAHERVKISLRVNFNHSNLNSIPRLLEMFPFDIRSHLRIVFEPIFGKCLLIATDNLPSNKISESITEYYKLASQLGYDVVLGQSIIYPGKLVYCYAERENQYIVNYNGDIYKCSVSEFNPKERVGYLRSDGVFVKDDEKWNKWVGLDLFEDQCYSCVYLPLCMGGCRKMRLQQKGTGNYCSLVPTNTSYLLKQIAFGGFEHLLHQECKLDT